MSGPYRKDLTFAQEEKGKNNFIYTLYANPWKALVTNADELELCETVQASKLGSQGATSLKSWFQVDWKANCPSNGVARSFKAQTSLLVWGSIKNQTKLYHIVNLALCICIFYKKYLSAVQIWCLSQSPALGRENFNLHRTQRAKVQLKLPLSWHCCCSYSEWDTETHPYLVPLTLMSPQDRVWCCWETKYLPGFTIKGKHIWQSISLGPRKTKFCSLQDHSFTMWQQIQSNPAVGISNNLHIHSVLYSKTEVKCSRILHTQGIIQIPQKRWSTNTSK